MGKSANTLGIIRTNATTKQERRLTNIIGKQTPVELHTTATRDWGLRVKEEVVDDAFVGLGGF